VYILPVNHNKLVLCLSCYCYVDQIPKNHLWKSYRGCNFQYFTLLEGNFNQWSSSLLTVAVVHNKQTKHYWHSCPSLQEVFITIRYDTIEEFNVDSKAVWVKKKSPPWGVLIFFIFFTNGGEFIIDFLHTCYTFLSTLDYKFLFNYPRFWRSYAILSATTQFTWYAQNVHNQSKRMRWHVCVSR